MTAIQALLHGLIDYAGLFPPAELDMKTVVRNYSEYRSGDNAWMLGRFVVPTSKLSEFAIAFDEACCDEQMSPWLLSVTGSGNADEDIQHIEEFVEGAAYLDAVEFKASDVASAESMLRLIPSSMAAYVEFALNKSEELLPLLKRYDARTKIRTGGITPEAIPDTEVIAAFLTACSKAKVAFKATAGLHHPMRSIQKLTDKKESASSIMHGFVNVFTAAVIAYQGAPINDIVSVLKEPSPEAFSFSDGRLSWCDYSLSTSQITEARTSFAMSFGSCSFAEPVQDLKALGWL